MINDLYNMGEDFFPSELTVFVTGVTVGVLFEAQETGTFHPYFFFNPFGRLQAVYGLRAVFNIKQVVSV